MRHAPAASFRPAPAAAPVHPPVFHRNLEALRGIAALLVVLHHLSLTPGSSLAGVTPLHAGWLFVDLFFVLSGFVIASVHLNSAASGAAARGFLIRRLFRLYPLHLATLVAALAADAVAGTAALPGYGAMVMLNLTLMHSWGLVPGSVLNGPSWSISAEWGAYLLFALICWVVPARRGRLWALGVVGTVSLASLLVWRGWSLEGDLTFRLPRCLLSFALGAATWAWCRQRPPLGAARAQALQLLAAAGMAGLLLSASVAPWTTLLMPVLSAAAIAAMARDPGSAVRHWLERRGPQWLGRHSYSLYLVHMPLFHLLLLATPGGWPASRSLADAWIAAALLILTVVSGVTCRTIEQPFRAWGRRLTSR